MIKANIIGLFCEDIREEKTGHTIIGIFPDNANVPSVPGALPKLGVYIRCHIDPRAKIKSLSAKLRLADGEEIQLAAFDEAAIKKTQAETRQKGTPLAGFIMIAVALRVKVTEAGRMLAIVNVGGTDVLAASLNLQLDPASLAASASQPPS